MNELTTVTMTDQERILAVFDALAAQQPRALQARLTDAGVPPPHDAFLELTASLAAVRRAIGQYTPRPALDSANAKEQAALTALLTDLVEEVTTSIAAPYIARATKVYQWARGALYTWNQRRPVQRATLTPEERALFANRVPPDKRDTVDVETIGPDGHTFILRPHITESRD